MRIVVDYDLCQSNAVCQDLAPQVFEVRDDGNLYLLTEEPPAELWPQVELAVRSCPTGALSLEE